MTTPADPGEGRGVTDSDREAAPRDHAVEQLGGVHGHPGFARVVEGTPEVVPRSDRAHVVLPRRLLGQRVHLRRLSGARSAGGSA